MKTRIESESGDSGRPYGHLLPVVQFIIDHGNEAFRPELFYNTQDGWRCDFKRPINLDEVENNFDLPDTIIINRKDNVIWCKKSWIEIQGLSS